MKKTTNKAAKSKKWLFAGGITASVAAYIFLLFLPGQRATADLRRELIRQQEFVLDCAQLGPRIRAAHEELARTVAFKEQWHAACASEERLAHVFVAITEHADTAGADIVRFEPQPAQPLDYVHKVPVELALEASFHQAFDFLARLETLDADLWVDTLTLDPIAAAPGKLRCELRLVLFAGGADKSNKSD